MIKRAFDLSVALLLLAVMAVPLLIVAILVRWKCGSPVFFVQERPGRGGRAFRMLKFRTMSDAQDSRNRLLPDSERLMPFGRWLRVASMDELPELINVLKGDMSLVGPRPLLMEYLPLYSKEQARRHEVKPGITGWAQVNGRNTLSWEEKFRFDVWYVDNQSFWLDLKILGMTLIAVLTRKGISQEGHPTMERFSGSPR